MTKTKRGDVTATQYFLEKTLANPYACHWCRNFFASKQMRYPIKTREAHRNGWGLASVCVGCFKCAGPDAVGPPSLKRHQVGCAGCGEPMMTFVGMRNGSWHVCSNRCAQRDYRKRRRAYASGTNGQARCQSCNQILSSMRGNARFCSNRCRQRGYRQRRLSGGANQGCRAPAS
jgi:hypothetical protein